MVIFHTCINIFHIKQRKWIELRKWKSSQRLEPKLGQENVEFNVSLNLSYWRSFYYAMAFGNAFDHSVQRISTWRDITSIVNFVHKIFLAFIKKQFRSRISDNHFLNLSWSWTQWFNFDDQFSKHCQYQQVPIRFSPTLSRSPCHKLIS